MARLYASRGLLHRKNQEYQGAIRNYDKAIELEPENAEHYLRRGDSYQNLGKQKEAISNYAKSLTLEPENAGSYYSRGSSYRSLTKYTMAIADFDIAIAFYPFSASHIGSPHACFYSRGVCYSNLKDFGKALEDFDEAVRLHQEEAPAYYYANRALAKEKLGLPAEAIEDRNHAQTQPLKVLQKDIRELSGLLRQYVGTVRRR